MLCGASAISPELAVPILPLVLYVWTRRRRGLQKHATNQSVIPIIPFEFGDLKEADGGSKCPLLFKCHNFMLNDRSQENFVQVEDHLATVPKWELHKQVADMKDLLHVGVIDYIITRVLQIKETWDSLKTQTSLTVLSMVDFIGLEKSFMKFSGELKEETFGVCNLETLERNLAALDYQKCL